MRATGTPRGHQTPFVLVHLAIAALALVTVTVMIANGVRAIHINGSSAHAAVIAGQHVTYPILNAAAGIVLLLAALGVAVVVAAARHGLREIRAQRRILTLLPGCSRLSGHPDVTVLDDPQPIAFCAGHLRPRVCVSTGALDALRPGELHAVLAHERHHRAARDPLRLSAARVLCGSLFFLPVLRSISDSYAAAVELDADRAALQASAGDHGPLARALLALTASGNPAMVGIAPERVDHLTGALRPWRAPVALLLLAALATCGVLIVDAAVVGGASFHPTLNFPVLSANPCIMTLAMIPLLCVSCALAVSRRRPATPGRSQPARLHT